MRSIEGFCLAAALASLPALSCKPFIAPKVDGGAEDAASEARESAHEAAAADAGIERPSLDGAPDVEVIAPETKDALADSDGDLQDTSSGRVDAALSDSASQESDAVEAPTPPQLPATGLVTQLEADYGLVVSADSLVSKWRDKSGRGFDASESDSSFQPVFIEDPAGGFGAVLFGVSSGADLNLPSGFSDLQSGVSIFFVINLQQTTGVAILLEVDPNGPVLVLSTDSTTNQVTVGYHVGPGSSPGGRVFNYPYGTWHLVELVQQGGSVGGTTSYTAYLDGTALVTSIQPVPSSEVKTAGIGPMLQQALTLVQAAVIYSRAVSNDERRQVEQYLMSKWHVSP